MENSRDNGITLHEWGEEYAEAVIDMINETWWKGSMNDHSSYVISEAMLRYSLQDQSYVRIAKKDGKVLGVIMGCDRRKHHATFSERIHFYRSALNILFNHDARKVVLEEGGEGKLHKELMRRGGNRKYDAEVTLFIVSKEARGLGVGKKLFIDLMEYFKASDVNSWYVFTDTDCSYGFYEHVGAVRRSELYEEYTLPDGRKGDITWFLYDYSRT